jgi:hypothetical protein
VVVVVRGKYKYIDRQGGEFETILWALKKNGAHPGVVWRLESAAFGNIGWPMPGFVGAVFKNPPGKAWIVDRYSGND